MSGGAGNDTYVVDSTGDMVTENAGQGTDAVNASVTYALTANVENLVLTGTGDIDGTGNALDNTLTGNSGANTLNGGDGADKLYGGGAADTLIGGNGADELDGGSGADMMTGGAGNDRYFVDNAGDTVNETPGGGQDTVLSLVDYALGANPGAACTAGRR